MDNMNKKEEDELRRRFQELLPRQEELQKELEARRYRHEQLRSDLAELKAELAARRENEGPPPWPGALEPLVLAAALLVSGGDIDSIAEKVMELSSRPYPVPAIRSTVHRLVRRELISESDRSFTVTPAGERELAQARDDANRWIAALGQLEKGGRK
jgi:hypothetical protein